MSSRRAKRTGEQPCSPRDGLACRQGCRQARIRQRNVVKTGDDQMSSRRAKRTGEQPCSPDYAAAKASRKTACITCSAVV